jgi:hypothetical protein
MIDPTDRPVGKIVPRLKPELLEHAWVNRVKTIRFAGETTREIDNTCRRALSLATVTGVSTPKCG